MDQSSYRRRSSPTRTTGGLKAVDFSQLPVKFLSSGTVTLTRTFTTCLILFSVLLAFSMIFHHHTSDPNRIMGFADARVLDGGGFHNVTEIGSIDSDKFDERLLGGLLAPGFDEDSCLSRYQQVLYRKPSSYKPSPYLISKLRNYEMRHKQCGPGTESYKKAIEQLDQEHITSNGECKYVVWVSFSGLGNRILSLASVYLYALLTDRVLLVDRGKDMNDLFCEPFPEMSWLLPLDFPLTGQFDGLTQQSSRSYGNMLKNRVIDSSPTEKTLSHLYLHLLHDYGDHDKMFFCEEDQTVFGKIPWLIVKTDNYFIPSLWLIPGFDHELDKLFPDKETVFHHIGRYLLHPTNQVWGLITRYYEAYLSQADEKIGIQVRVFDEDPGPFQHVMDQISACTQREKLLPEVDTIKSQVTTQRSPKLKAVLVTSLSSGYSENLKSIYWEYPTLTGDIIGVHQPSQEGYQQTEKKMHNGKALAEMYLLSMTDNLVTSAWSTFGYVAQGLGGLKPWILYRPENRTAPDPPCARAMSMEPCFHSPPFYDCKAKTGTDTGNLVPHVRHCEDISWGLKLVNSHNEL